MGLFSRTPSVRGDAAVRMAADGATLLDVRESHEWNAGHAPGAQHVPLGRIADAPRRLRKDRPVLVMCRSGNRSRSAAAYLRGQGYEVFNVKGGIRAWQAGGGRVVGKGNRPGVIA